MIEQLRSAYPLVALEPAQADKLRGVLRTYGLPLS